MKKRALVLFTLLLFILSGVVLQVYRLSDAYLSQAADQQGSVTVKVANSRGTIYDARLRPLTNAGEEYRLSVTPSPEAIAALSGMLDEEQLAAVSERLQSGKPAVVTLPEIPANLEGSLLFKVPVRYGGRLLAPHLLGYMDGDGLHGLTGVELAFDAYLNSCGGQASVTYSVDAMGKPLQGIAPQVVNTLADAKAGVVLTIDQDIQKIAEEAAKRYMTKGAVVVMEPATGRIAAMVSLPDFQPGTVADSLDAADSPLLNRALCNYNLGSVFKITSAAAALEKGIPISTAFTCNGSVTIGNVTFHCHNRLGHGTLNMQDGFAQSCNPYFIQLMQQAGSSALLGMASNLGFDRSLILADGLKTARATLPTAEELLSPAAVGNLAFGQGSLLGTPVHVAQMVAAVVNGGKIIRPTILKGYCDKEGRLSEETIEPEQTVFSKQTAQTLKDLMIYAVKEGTGTSAQPTVSAGAAGGKTGTAETGWKSENKAVVQSWFGGFYPAENPKYVIAVIAEDSDNTKGKSSPVFKKICEDIYMLEQARKVLAGETTSTADPSRLSTDAFPIRFPYGDH